jgi:2-polyprenyl-3-methyl-5-hydroxy-6-metoxy-1,4-benzoquinol methylase
MSKQSGRMRALKQYLIPRVSLLAWAWDANAGDRRKTYERMNGPDTHWQFASEPEMLRHKMTLELISRHRALSELGAVLEIGCANGEFTEQLSRVVTQLSACDISERACTATHARVPAANVFPLDILKSERFGQYDVVIAMDLLDCIQLPWRVSTVIDRLVAATKPNGILVISSTRLAEAIRGGMLARLIGAGADYHYRLLLADSRLERLEAESFTFPQHGYPEHLIAAFRRIR